MINTLKFTKDILYKDDNAIEIKRLEKLYIQNMLIITLALISIIKKYKMIE